VRVIFAKILQQYGVLGMEFFSLLDLVEIEILIALTICLWQIIGCCG